VERSRELARAEAEGERIGAKALSDDEKLAAIIMLTYDMEPATFTPQWAMNYVRAGKDEPHSGDCTKQSWTCMRCCYDEAMKMVPAIKDVLLAAGYAPKS